MTAQRVDVHSFSEPHRVLVEHLNLKLSVDIDARVIRGTVDLRLKRIDTSARSLILDSRALRVERVAGSKDGKRFSSREFSFGPSDRILGRALRITLSPGDRWVRVVYRTTSSSTALQWLSPGQTASGEAGFLFTQSQEIHARSWIPLQDSPGVRVTFKASVDGPRGLTAVMGADLVRGNAAAGRFAFEMRQPIPPYLIALAVGRLQFRATGRRTGVYAESPIIDAAAREFADGEKMLEAAERLYGAYRWGRFDVLVLPPSFPFGGMEIPKLTFVTPTIIAGDKSLVGLLAHELAHSWSGNLVTNATWSDFWLNEGFTTYIEQRLVEELYGVERAQMAGVLSRRELDAELSTLPKQDQLLRPDLAGRDPDEGATLVPYQKGALFLQTIEHAVGRRRFDRFLRAYFDHFAFQSVTTADALQFMKDHLLKNFPKLLPALDEWVFKPGVPDSAPDVRSKALERIEQQAAAWSANRLATRRLHLDALAPFSLLHFLDSLPAKVKSTRMAELDSAFGFSQSENSEVLFRWLLLSVRNGYRGADRALEQFLAHVGRRKYVKPLYQALATSASRRARARALYGRVRRRYHPITRASVDSLFDPPRSRRR